MSNEITYFHTGQLVFTIDGRESIINISDGSLAQRLQNEEGTETTGNIPYGKRYILSGTFSYSLEDFFVSQPPITAIFTFVLESEKKSYNIKIFGIFSNKSLLIAINKK